MPCIKRRAAIIPMSVSLLNETVCISERKTQNGAKLTGIERASERARRAFSERDVKFIATAGES